MRSAGSSARAAAAVPVRPAATRPDHRSDQQSQSYNNFAAWCRFGNGGVIADNDPDEQEKIVKFSTLLTNCVVFHTTVDMMAVLRDLIAEGWTITAGDLAVLSPYLTARIQRFGVYATDEITLKPDAYNARLGVGLADTGTTPRPGVE